MIRVFIKANLQFTYQDHTLKFKNKNISSYGAFGLPWPPLDPEQDFGKQVGVHLELMSTGHPRIHTKASLLWEHSRYGDTMGLRFYLDEADRKRVLHIIDTEGFY